MKEYFKSIIKAIGEDPDREGLRNTPERAAKAMEFLTAGYTMSAKDIVNGALFESRNSEMIIVRNIELYSLCEHHLLPFIGKCHVAYVPEHKIIGLSKVARLVDMHARRLQVQENLTNDIADTIMEITGAKGVGVVVDAQHLCMMMRGVEKQNSIMTTSVMRGLLREDARTRGEFLSLIRSSTGSTP